jgi:type VII secretion protein EccB
MTSRRDQVQAYGFVVGRLNSALVHGEPDALHPPMQRTRSATLGGVVLGLLAVGGFLLWGLISPVHKAVAPPTAGDLVVVPQTGARYLYNDGKLSPVLNWSSALMLTSGAPQVENETAASIASLPLGPSLGLLGAPDSLPAEINHGDWLACATDSGGRPQTAVAIGASPPAAAPVPSGQALLVAVSGSSYLIWAGTRLRLDAPWMASALGLGQAPVTTVSQTWLNAVPAGPDLRAFSLPGTGDPGPVLDGQPTRVGEVLLAQEMGGADALFLVEKDGVAAITAIQAALDLASPGTAAAYPGRMAQPVTVSAPAIASAPHATQSLPDGTGDPASLPVGVGPPNATDVPCLAWPARGGAPSLLWAAPPSGSAPDPRAPGVTGAATSANLISVVPGGGALVQPVTATGAKAGPLYLVTGTGVRFEVPTANQASVLGYAAGQAAALPATLLALLPTGPSLNLAPLSQTASVS